MDIVKFYPSIKKFQFPFSMEPSLWLHWDPEVFYTFYGTDQFSDLKLY